MSQPVLRAVMEDKERFSSLGRIKKKMLKGQGTFDGEENAVLYQNYKEKALDIDSDEESEPKEQKSDEKIVIHHKPLRSTWSQLSAMLTRNSRTWSCHSLVVWKALVSDSGMHWCCAASWWVWQTKQA
ncbi:rho guanine nucleotide exchange factor 26-like [Canis lupus familiaris]|uniref:rho guanine nucleotide exchange factor 26-like n=1 Tax=Canis lupus familiaris TaxID=9615 RepID=UPI0018F6227C|nr:rho guanine nucleotide exchange factor 26-like [Canis lupus familiaris]